MKGRRYRVDEIEAGNLACRTDRNPEREGVYRFFEVQVNNQNSRGSSLSAIGDLN
jgi:hypothetical protein